MRAWTETKSWVVDAIGLNTNFLHIPIGLLIFLILAGLFRKHKDALFIALLGLSALQLLNEVLDGIQWRIWTGGVSWLEAVEDTVLTIAIPLTITAGVALVGSRRGHIDEGSSTTDMSSENLSDGDDGSRKQL